MEVSQSCFCCVVSSCFRAGEEEQQAQSKKALKKQQKEAEKAAKKAEKQAKLVSVCQETQTLPTVLPTAHHCRMEGFSSFFNSCDYKSCMCLNKVAFVHPGNISTIF